MSLVTRDAWRISERDFPAEAPVEARLRFLVRYAILAPSTRNTQPWRFTVEADTVRLFADRARGQPVFDPGARELYISLGCALENLLIAAEHFGFGHETTYFPDPGNAELVASVVFAPGGEPSPARAGITMDALVRRHNDNSVYRSTPVPAEVRARLEACYAGSELRLDLTDDYLFRRWVDELTLEADRLAFADPAFREELGHWIGQGVFGNTAVMSRLGRLAVSRLDLGEPMARQDRERVESAALLGLVSAREDTHLSHVRAGQLFERLWITATAMGVSVHPMSQTMQRPELRAAVAELIPERGWMPQHLFRVGYTSRHEETHRHTPRRPLGEVLAVRADGSGQEAVRDADHD